MQPVWPRRKGFAKRNDWLRKAFASGLNGHSMRQTRREIVSSKRSIFAFHRAMQAKIEKRLPVDREDFADLNDCVLAIDRNGR